MLRIDDVTGKTFTISRARDGYETSEVDEFRTDVVEAITLRDSVISELQEDLAAARTRSKEDALDGLDADSVRRESSVSAVRLLEIAAVNADQLVADAKLEASSLLRSANVEAEQVLTASRAEVERVTAELDSHQEEQAAELDRLRTDALAELADERATLEAQVERLRRLEHEHRGRLRDHFAEQLALLEDDAPAVLRAVAD